MKKGKQHLALLLISIVILIVTTACNKFQNWLEKTDSETINGNNTKTVTVDTTISIQNTEIATIESKIPELL